jgi:vacuolar-type H+-ATPase subunit E/Vma4
MSLETLVDEIRRRGEAGLADVTAERAAATKQLLAERDERVAAIRAESARETDLEVAHERAQRIAAAKLESRKLLYEAREQRLEGAIEETRSLLRDYTRSPQYPAVLKRMMAAATETLGKQVRIFGRSEDASVLSKVAGRSFDPTPQPILGGLIAETPDGNRRLNLSFDELLRLREDRVRELLA